MREDNVFTGVFLFTGRVGISGPMSFLAGISGTRSLPRGEYPRVGTHPLGWLCPGILPRVGYSPPHWVLTPGWGMDMSMGVDTHPPINEILRDTVYKRAVRILLEWFLVVMKLRTLFSIVPIIPGLYEDGTWLSTVLLM